MFDAVKGLQRFFVPLPRTPTVGGPGVPAATGTDDPLESPRRTPTLHDPDAIRPSGGHRTGRKDPVALARTSHLVASAAVVADRVGRRHRGRVTPVGAIEAPPAGPVAAVTGSGVLTGVRPGILERPLAPAVQVGRLRRCTFRRLDPVGAPGRGPQVSYSAMCLYPGLPDAAPLGGLAEASVACNACTFSGIFRADED